MKLMQCNKKHYYDGDKFVICPYCTGATGNFSIMDDTVDVSGLKTSVLNGESQYTSTIILEDESQYTPTVILEDESDSKTVLLFDEYRNEENS